MMIDGYDTAQPSSEMKVHTSLSHPILPASTLSPSHLRPHPHPLRLVRSSISIRSQGEGEGEEKPNRLVSHQVNSTKPGRQTP